MWQTLDTTYYSIYSSIYGFGRLETNMQVIMLSHSFPYMWWLEKTSQDCSGKYRVSAIKKTNQIANRPLHFEAGNGNLWGPRTHERKLLIGPEHTLHWIHWRISCSCVGKHGWKTVESRCNLVWFLGGSVWYLEKTRPSKQCGFCNYLLD